MEPQTTTARISLKYGIISAVGSIIFITILYLTDQSTNAAISWLGMIIPIAAMVMGMKEFRSLNQGFMTYGQGVGIGTLMSAISGFLSSVYTYIYNIFIDPTLRQQVLDKVRDDLESKGMDDTQIEAALEMTQKFSTPGITFFVGILMSIIMGFIFSLIISAIFKKDKPFDLE